MEEQMDTTHFMKSIWLSPREGQIKMIYLIPPEDTANKRMLPFHHQGQILKTETPSSVSPVF